MKRKIKRPCDNRGLQTVWGVITIILAVALMSGFYVYFIQGSSDDKLTIYSGRSSELVDDIIDDFETTTGIEVEVKYGSTSEMAGTLLEEGDDSPADVFYAQDPGGIGAVEDMLATLPEDVLEMSPERFRSPEDKWVGISGRARVVVYNTDALEEDDLPDSIEDFTDPEWEGRIGWAPTNPSFQTMVTSMRAVWGEERTEDWIEGIQDYDPTAYSANTPTVKAVADGEVDVGFVNHYYLFRFLEEEGKDFSARNYHPRDGGPGSTMMISGAGLLETSDNQEEGEKFLEFLLSREGQEYFAEQTFEYPVHEDVETHSMLKSLDDIDFPEVSMEDMDDLEGTLDLLRETGVIS